MSAVNWVLTHSSDGLTVHDRDGIDWYDAPKPWFLHRCVVQTRAWAEGIRIERCACGAINFNPEKFGTHWEERNRRVRWLPRLPRLSSRRKLIWGLVTFVVALTIGMFLGGRADAAVPSPSPQAPPVPPAGDPSMTLWAALVLVAGMVALSMLCVGVLYLIEALREKWRRVEADMDALIEASHECPPNGPCAWCVSLPDDDRDDRERAEAMVNKLRGDDRIGQFISKAETELCEELWALPVADEPRRAKP